MATSAQSSMATIESFISQVGRVKQAEAGTEPGSIGGATSHPVKNVDDRTEPAKEGKRSKENSSDVKEDQGKPGVESAAEATAKSASAKGLAAFAKKAEGAVSSPGSAADDHLQIGTNVQATGDDKSNETNSAKAGKEDPGSDHPARTDNDSLDGHKYAGDDGLRKIASDMESIANRICTSIMHSTQSPQVKQAAAQHAGRQVAPQTAYQAGWEAAGLPMDKNAADQMVHATFVDIIKTASDDADNVIDYLNSFFKAAEGEELPPEEGGGGGGDMPPVDPSAMAGGPMPPMGDMGGGGGGGGGGGEGALMDALGGGEDAGGGGGDMGGGGGEGGPGGVEDVLALMDQLGVTPEDIMAAADEGGGGGDMGGGGGGDPLAGAGGGGEPPPEKAGSDKGRGKVPLPKGITKQAMKSYLEELVQRSKAKK